MANDGKDRERMDLLTARFIQIQAIPESTMHPPRLLALDERGRVWDYNFEHTAWTMMPQDRALPSF